MLFRDFVSPVSGVFTMLSSLLRTLQAKVLPNATSPISKSYLLNKMGEVMDESVTDNGVCRVAPGFARVC